MLRRNQKWFLFTVAILCGGWGFFGHQKINRLAVFTLPTEMITFYKHHIRYISEAAVNPDRRRYAVEGEGARHYIDLDAYGDSAAYKLPRYWNEAVEKFGEDSLQERGIVPWHIYRAYFQLRDAFMMKDPSRILKQSAEIGHYIADAHVPLHTTSNYDGQLTNQVGIHAFWESRLPELFFNEYDFYVGKASYIKNVQLASWDAVTQAHAALDSVLKLEGQLSLATGGLKFSYETKGRQTERVFSFDYSKKYHALLNGMVERQMRHCIKMIGDVWYTAWVDAGQPDLKALINYQPTEEELMVRKAELEKWKTERIKQARKHEVEDVDH